MSNRFGVVESSIFRSRKFRPLSPLGKLIYLTCHFSPHRNAIGVYTLPVIFLADDLNIDPDEAKAGLQEIIDAGLVQYDFEESLIRVTAWERRNAPQGPTEAIGRITKNFDNAPANALTIAAFLSFSHHILHKAVGTAKGGEGWNVTEARSKMEKMIFHRLEGFAKSQTEMFIEAFDLFNGSENDEVFAFLWESLKVKFDTLYDTLSDTLDIPTSIHSGILDQRSLTKEQGSKNKIIDQRTRSENREQGGIDSSSASAQSPSVPSPRKGASRTALKGKRKTTGAGSAAKTDLGKGQS